jgi:pimeloyl-ACP methyl ester carboxylesterase
MHRVLLLHGWDWEKYPVFKLKHQWQNRKELVEELGKHYDTDYPSLPGFSRMDAHRAGSWTLDDYADWLQGEVVEQRYDAIIGYSFGCAVATRWQYLYRNSSVPLILLSPAVARAYGKPPNKILTTVASVLKFLRMERVVYFLRNLYLTRVIKNPHVIHGTPFLRSTYFNIVSVDLSGELAQLIDANYAITCVFGSEDTATPPEILFARTPAARPLSLIIPAGTHDIGRTHPKEVVGHIVDFLNPPKAQ